MADHENEHLSALVGVVKRQAERLCPYAAPSAKLARVGVCEVLEIELACGRRPPFRIEWQGGEVVLVLVGRNMSEARLVIGVAGSRLDAAKLHAMLSCFMDQAAACDTGRCPIELARFSISGKAAEAGPAVGV